MTPPVRLLEIALFAIDLRVAPLAILSCLVLAAIALSSLSLLAAHRARELARAVEERAGADQAQWRSLMESLQEAQSSLSAELREVRQQSPGTGAPADIKPGFNLTTRSQALRMHRLGDPPERIAAALNLPRQEVDLLLKVHRLVIRNL
ncbi:MAG TPA: hypothetical protein VMH81_12735 [Bryobacteraceae bacterium]|nr:hypothetical protein [Bryobacteraceae bacterium]